MPFKRGENIVEMAICYSLVSQSVTCRLFVCKGFYAVSTVFHLSNCDILQIYACRQKTEFQNQVNRNQKIEGHINFQAFTKPFGEKAF